MPGILRFLLYDDSGRQTYIQIYPDTPVEQQPRFGFGRKLRLPDGHSGPMESPVYVVTNQISPKQEPDPDNPACTRTVYEIFLARAQEWSSFKIPDEL